MPRASEIADYLDHRLRTSEVPDYPGAVNGLQLASTGEIRRVAAAVDFSHAVVRAAVRRDAQLLLVHHGMFWGAPQPITGWRYEALAALIDRGIAVYSSHLPLDLHPELGNNVLLAEELELKPTSGFASFKNVVIGVSGESNVPTAKLSERARTFAAAHGGHLVATPHESNRVTQRWGICTGAGADSETLHEAVQRGIDTLIVGEGPHHTAVQARNLDLVILYVGHYATETLGVRALARDVAGRFGLDFVFIEEPSGL
jgi:dinuclear metal center YbgI/SA1388 family protein